jgi:hypothetical protein
MEKGAKHAHMCCGGKSEVKGEEKDYWKEE